MWPVFPLFHGERTRRILSKMLTEAEKKGCFRLLQELSNEEILSLKNTITNRLIAAENREEAVKAILEYSQSAVELLRRKKMRRDLLFQYLAECHVVVPVNAEKRELIKQVLRHWGSAVPTKEELMDFDEAASPTEQYKRTNAPPTPNMQQRLGETFARWFYKLLNSENPSATQAGDDNFGPHHFWENCTFKMVIRGAGSREETFDGNVLVAQRLQALVTEESLLFNPNISPDGVRVQSSPHGLVIVMVCGTVHQDDNCLGVFEQMFGLVSNPLNENNWKVKVSQLLLHSSQVNALPTLSDSTARELVDVAGSMAVASRA